MLCFFVTVIIACGAVAQRPVLNNDNLDKTMEWHNRMLANNGFGLTQIPPLDLGLLRLENGVQVGMDSLYRTGDSFVWKVGTNSFFYSNQIGYRLLVFAFGKISFDSQTFSGLLRVHESSMQFDYTVHNDSDCSVTLDQYRFTTFKGLEFVSSSPDFPDGMVPDDIFGNGAELLTLVNGLLASERTYLEQHLQPLCRTSGHDSAYTTK